MEGGISTELGDSYLYYYSEIFSNVYISPVLRIHVIGRYFSSWYEIDNEKRMRKSDLALEKYLMA